jgi:hypothetical protein
LRWEAREADSSKQDKDGDGMRHIATTHDTAY